MSRLNYPDTLIRRVLEETKAIAMVGASANWVRPSNFAMKYLQQKGYRVIPVNPGSAGEKIHGETCYAALADIPDDYQMGKTACAFAKSYVEDFHREFDDCMSQETAPAPAPSPAAPPAPGLAPVTNALAPPPPRRASSAGRPGTAAQKLANSQENEQRQLKENN